MSFRPLTIELDQTNKIGIAISMEELLNDLLTDDELDNGYVSLFHLHDILRWPDTSLDTHDICLCGKWVSGEEQNAW